MRLTEAQLGEAILAYLADRGASAPFVRLVWHVRDTGVEVDIHLSIAEPEADPALGPARVYKKVGDSFESGAL